MNSIFCGVNAAETSLTSLSPLNNFFFFVLIVSNVPDLTEYISSRIGSPLLLIIVLPLLSFFFFQFLRSRPIPPVTSTVVKKIGDIPFVPATTGAMLIKGTYGLACFPIHNETLFIPDILDDPTPIVPFSARSITVLSGCFFCKSNSSFC